MAAQAQTQTKLTMTAVPLQKAQTKSTVTSGLPLRQQEPAVRAKPVVQVNEVVIIEAAITKVRQTPKVIEIERAYTTLVLRAALAAREGKEDQKATEAKAAMVRARADWASAILNELGKDVLRLMLKENAQVTQGEAALTKVAMKAFANQAAEAIAVPIILVVGKENIC